MDPPGTCRNCRTITVKARPELLERTSYDISRGRMGPEKRISFRGKRVAVLVSEREDSVRLPIPTSSRASPGAVLVVPERIVVRRTFYRTPGGFRMLHEVEHFQMNGNQVFPKRPTRRYASLSLEEMTADPRWVADSMAPDKDLRAAMKALYG